MSAPGAQRRVASLLALGGAIAAFAVDLVYARAIVQQGVTPPGGRVVFVAAWIAGAGALAAIGAFAIEPRRRSALLGLAAAMLFALAVPAVFSIGLPLMLCGALVGIAAVRAGQRARLASWVGLVAPLVLILVAGLGVVAGFAVTDL